MTAPEPARARRVVRLGRRRVVAGETGVAGAEDAATILREFAADSGEDVVPETADELPTGEESAREKWLKEQRPPHW